MKYIVYIIWLTASGQSQVTSIGGFDNLYSCQTTLGFTVDALTKLNNRIVWQYCVPSDFFYGATK